jgi:hypothetical protein
MKDCSTRTVIYVATTFHGKRRFTCWSSTEKHHGTLLARKNTRKHFFDVGTISAGAQKCAASGLHRPTHQRPARTTNPIVPTERWYGDSGKVCANVTGNSAQADGPYPSRALGLHCTEAASNRSGRTQGHPAAAMGDQE